METLLVFLRFFELSACITAFVYWKNIKNSCWKIFAFYLAFIISAEFLSQFLQYPFHREANRIFYNYIVIPTEFLFYYWLFSQAFKNWKYKKLPAISMGVYIISWVFDMAYFSGQKFFFYSFSYSIGNILMLVLILMYFIRLVNSAALLYFYQDMLFWVSVGLLVFYLGTFPYFALLNTMWYKYPTLLLVYSKIMYILNCLMYLMFTFSFIWGKPNLKYSSS